MVLCSLSFARVDRTFFLVEIVVESAFTIIEMKLNAVLIEFKTK